MEPNLETLSICAFCFLETLKDNVLNLSTLSSLTTNCNDVMRSFVSFSSRLLENGYRSKILDNVDIDWQIFYKK